MDTSAKYKKLAHRSTKMQSLWVPTIGDFWSCSCSSCIERDFSWVLEQADVLAIGPVSELDRYWRETKNAAMTSRDAGFGAFWIHKNEPDGPGFVWLPRLDQLMLKAAEILNMHFVHAHTEFNTWVKSETMLYTPCSFPFTSLEQLALTWVNRLLPD